MGLIDKIGEVLHLGESEDFELQNIKQEWKIEESVPLVIVRWGANPPPPNKEILMYSVFGIDKESGKHKWGFMDNPIGMLLDNENGYVSSQSSRNYKARSIRGVTSGIVLAEGNISFDIFSKINSCISGNLVELEGEIMQIRSIIFRNRIRNRFNPLLLPKFMWDNLRKNMAAEVFNTTVVPSSSYYNPFKFITNAIHKFIILTDVGDYYAIDFKGSLNHGLTQRTRVKVSGSLNKANRTVLAKSIIVSDVELSEKVSLPISEKGFKNVSAISGSVISSEIRPINCENYRDWLFSQVRVYNGNEWIGAIEELYRNYRDQFSTEEFMLPTYFLKLHSENDKTELYWFGGKWNFRNLI